LVHLHTNNNYMPTQISLRPYFGLPQNQVLKFKYNGETIYGHLLSLGSPAPYKKEFHVNEESGTLSKILDFDSYRKNPKAYTDYEQINIDSAEIEGSIEIVDTLN
jgi:hypothetical protein